MNADFNKKSTWWREPMVWLIMALPFTAVVAGLTTVWIAYSKADKVLTDQDSRGIEVTKANEMDKRAHFLAIAASIDTVGDRLTLALDGRRLQAKPDRLTLRVIHQTGTGADTLLVLQARHDGKYASVLPAMHSGPCKVILEPEDQTWRLTGQWQTPFSGALKLSARSISDSSMLP